MSRAGRPDRADRVGRAGQAGRWAGDLRGRLAAALALLGLLAAAAPAAAQDRAFRLQGLDGSEFRPQDLGQGVVIAVVFASWSPRCRDVVARADAIAGRWGRQARVILVSFQEEPSAVRQFLGSAKPKAPVYLDQDGSFSKRFSVTSLPGLVIFKDGATGFTGKLPDAPDALISQTVG